MPETINAQQRAQYFAMSTRQNMQMLAKETITNFPNSAMFTLPKARLLSGLYLKIKVHFSELPVEVLSKQEQLFKLVRRISLDLNNGFQPYVISGEGCRLYNLIDLNTRNVLDYWAVDRVSNDKVGNVIEYNFYLSCTTNPRDPVGLILLQNDQTNVTLNIDMGLSSETGVDGLVEPTKAEISCMAETFSIPANANAFPDLSVLKMVHGRKDSLPTEGQQVIKLATGTIYRKLIFKLTDENGAPMTPDMVTSTIDLVFNQADVNYSISADMLRTLNAKQFGCYLPDGVYVFDFSNSGGLPNLGGTRDFIDSANLTEFWLRFTTNAKGKCEIVSETLARLNG